MSGYIDITEIAQMGRLGTKLARDLVPGDIILKPHTWNNRHRQQFRLERVVEPLQHRLEFREANTPADAAWFDTVPMQGTNRLRSNVLTDADHAYRTLEMEPADPLPLIQPTA